MSLLIVGSCSRVTSNIVLALTRSGLYSSITISDPLPVYEHHQRYYRLRKLLNEQRSSIPVVLDKLLSVENLAKQIAAHRDVLHITHDYFTSVTSKNKIMELTARLASNVFNSSGRKTNFSLLPLSSTITTARAILNRYS